MKVPKQLKDSLLAVENVVKTASQKPRQRPNMIQPEIEEETVVSTKTTVVVEQKNEEEEDINEEDFLFITQFKKRKTEEVTATVSLPKTVDNKT